MPLIAGIGAGVGAIGGLFKSGPELDKFGRKQSGEAYTAYKNLVSKGPGASDVSNAYEASRNYAEQLNNTASSGLYNQAAGNRLAEQQFAGQRESLAQSLQDQMAVANRAASSAGRSSNDPILRARLGVEAMRQTASLNSQQASAALDLGRQSTMDTLNLSGQRVNTLQGLSQQAFQGQQSLFDMGGMLQQMDYNAASYENSRGGGIKGAITGAITGAGAGLQLATGFGNIKNVGDLTKAQVGMMDRIGQAMPGMAQMGANMTAPSQAQVPSFLQSNVNYSGPGYSDPNSPLTTGKWFDVNNTSFLNSYGPMAPGYSPAATLPPTQQFNWQSGGYNGAYAPGFGQSGNPFGFLAPGSALRR